MQAVVAVKLPHTSMPCSKPAAQTPEPIRVYRTYPSGHGVGSSYRALRNSGWVHAIGSDVGLKVAHVSNVGVAAVVRPTEDQAAFKVKYFANQQSQEHAEGILNQQFIFIIRDPGSIRGAMRKEGNSRPPEVLRFQRTEPSLPMRCEIKGSSENSPKPTSEIQWLSQTSVDSGIRQTNAAELVV